MVLKPDQQRIKDLLQEAIPMLCKNGLHYKTEFSIEALIGITLDNEVFLVSIKDTVTGSDLDQTLPRQCFPGAPEEEVHAPLPSPFVTGMPLELTSQKQRKRRHERQSDSGVELQRNPMTLPVTKRQRSDSDMPENRLPLTLPVSLPVSVPAPVVPHPEPKDIHFIKHEQDADTNCNILPNMISEHSQHLSKSNLDKLAMVSSTPTTVHITPQGLPVKDHDKLPPQQLPPPWPQPPAPHSLHNSVSVAPPVSSHAPIVQTAPTTRPSTPPILPPSSQPRVASPQEDATDDRLEQLLVEALLHPGPLIMTRSLQRHGSPGLRHLSVPQMSALFEEMESRGLGRNLHVPRTPSSFMFAKKDPQAMTSDSVVIGRLSVAEYRSVFESRNNYMERVSKRHFFEIYEQLCRLVGVEYANRVMDICHRPIVPVTNGQHEDAGRHAASAQHNVITEYITDSTHIISDSLQFNNSLQRLEELTYNRQNYVSSPRTPEHVKSQLEQRLHPTQKTGIKKEKE